MNNILHLGSQSKSRQKLLGEAGIPFLVVEQRADEEQFGWHLPLEQLVSCIAKSKMEHAQLPKGSLGSAIFVLTADTLSQDLDGTIRGKPLNRDNARIMLRAAQQGSRLCTAFCLDKRRWNGFEWVVERRIEQAVHARYQFNIPEAWLDKYLAAIPVSDLANAISIEGFGSQFLEHVSGSYSAIVGLPMFEVRKALEELDFW